MTLRPAVAADEPQVLEWRNLPWVVALGVTKKKVTSEQHHAWFRETLDGTARVLFIVHVGGEPAGTIRYDALTDGAVEISLYLMPQYQGRGIGGVAFAKSLPRLLSWRKTSSIMARILHSNARSQVFFRKLGFGAPYDADPGEVVTLTRAIEAIPHSRPFVGHEESEAAARVVASGHLAQGAETLRLEERWCAMTGSAHAACTGSGVGALRLALLALGVGEGHEVILPAYSCVALPNAVLSLGATPVLADVAPGTWTLDPKDLEARITPRTRAVLATDLFGAPAPIKELAQTGVPVIEDCAHGIGGTDNGRPFGSAATLTIASFYATKMICAGEGGIVSGNDGALLNRVRQARGYAGQPPDGRHLNDKITDVEAAIALEQLAKCEDMLARRRERAERYTRLLGPLVEQGLIHLPPDTPGRIWYRYALRLRRHAPAGVCAWMAGQGVHAEQPVWDLRGTPVWDGACRNAAAAFDEVLSLPLYPDLTPLEQERVSETLALCLETL